MKVVQRARMAGVVIAMAAVIGGTGFAVGTVTAEPGQAASPPAVTARTGDAARSGYAAVVRKVLPSVVLIRTATGLGSGVVLDDEGNIVTNAHVAGNATSFQVQLAHDPQPRQARLVGSYPAGDLAVIRVDDRAGLVPASFGNSDKTQAGDVVLAVGNPLGLSGSVTEGIISATGRAVTEPASQTSPGTTLPDTIQTSAPINPGNSGGALVNTSGQVIGIPTLAAGSSQSGSQAQGIGFAIPSNLARDIAGQLINTGHVTSTHRAAIGAQVATIISPHGIPAGAGIVAVTKDGPADRAGLRPGDVIKVIGQSRTPDATALAQALAAQDPGQNADVCKVPAWASPAFIAVVLAAVATLSIRDNRRATQQPAPGNQDRTDCRSRPSPRPKTHNLFRLKHNIKPSDTAGRTYSVRPLRAEPKLVSSERVGYPYAVNWAVCAEVGVEPNRLEYVNPELGDDRHGQYDPAGSSGPSLTYEPENR